MDVCRLANPKSERPPLPTRRHHFRGFRCHPSTQCQDTEQSYECVCPQGYEGEGSGRCGGKSSTAQCCGPTGADACKHAFVCVPSTAKGAHDGCKGQCVKEATCVLISKDRDLYECQCPDGQFGNGKHCFGGGPPPPAIFDRHGNLQGPILAEDYCGWCVRAHRHMCGWLGDVMRWNGQGGRLGLLV